MCFEVANGENVRKENKACYKINSALRYQPSSSTPAGVASNRPSDSFLFAERAFQAVHFFVCDPSLVVNKRQLCRFPTTIRMVFTHAFSTVLVLDIGRVDTVKLCRTQFLIRAQRTFVSFKKYMFLFPGLHTPENRSVRDGGQLLPATAFRFAAL